jgi:hypothetical protein
MEIYGLLIKKQYLDLILDGSKVWELRSRNTSRRGVICLIESGSGLIRGLADLSSTIKLDKTTYDDNYELHQIGIPYEDCRWNKYAWEFDSVEVLDHPIAYQHPQGAVIWVNLSDKILNSKDKDLLENMIATYHEV